MHFLVYVFVDVHRLTAFQIIFDVATKNQGLVQKYNIFLHELTYRPQSMLNRVDAIMFTISFIKVTRPAGLAYTANCFSDIDGVVAIVKERLSKELKAAAGETSIEQLISQRRWTEDGLQGLRSLLGKGWPYFDSLVALCQVTIYTFIAFIILSCL